MLRLISDPINAVFFAIGLLGVVQAGTPQMPLRIVIPNVPPPQAGLEAQKAMTDAFAEQQARSRHTIAIVATITMPSALSAEVQLLNRLEAAVQHSPSTAHA